jgi:uncharacterized protein YggL (DUF469 family)
MNEANRIYREAMPTMRFQLITASHAIWKIKKMKKRLRKKKPCGEFTEWGRQLVITRNRKDGFDEFLDAFIEEAIEANGCYCGGGGKEDKLDVVVELGRRSEDPAVKLQKITAWLNDRPDVQSWRTGDEFDLWHGDFHDIEDQIARVEASEADKTST